MFSKKGLHPISLNDSHESGYSSPDSGYSSPGNGYVSSDGGGVSASDMAGFPATDEQPTSVTTVVQPGSVMASPLVATPPVAQRAAVLIPSTGKKSSGTMRPPKPRRLVINIGAAIVLLIVVVGALAAVIPTSNSRASGGLFSIFQPKMSSVVTHTNPTALIAAQAATATAVMQDGYDAGGNVTYDGVNRDYSLGDGQSTLDIAAGGGSTNTSLAAGKVSAANLVIRATPGQCTYYADYRYWQETGYEVPWAGNADTYAYQAPSYGWINSSVPVVGSIIVLQPGVQGAGYGTGHVGIVDSINADGSLTVSSWNIVGPGILSVTTYYTGAGVSFVYHP